MAPTFDGVHCPFCGGPLRVVEPLVTTGQFTAWEEDACIQCGRKLNLGYKLVSVTERLLDEAGEDNGREGPELLTPEEAD